jgi:hypothetical protein
VHLASVENRLDVVTDNVRGLHSTTKSRGALHDEPRDLPNFLQFSCPNFKSELIDGTMLGRLMIEHNAGVSATATYQFKRVDSDYFAE